MSAVIKVRDLMPAAVQGNHAGLARSLPRGAALRLTDVTWREYEDLLTELDETPGLRLTYDHGNLEIMTLSPEHEGYVRLFGYLVSELTQELDLDFIDLGSTTQCVQMADSGAEPDACFYIGDFAAVAGKKRLDLSVDPPPDLAIEIDITHRSVNKLTLYAGLKIGEIWLYDGKVVRFYKLGRKRYREFQVSDLFPFVAARDLAPFLKQGRNEGINAMRRAFRQWVGDNRK
ncbi:MAG: Uma2 family endonuclease [Blastocatellia bacterium]